MLYDDLLSEFRTWLGEDEKIQTLWNKTKENRANYRDAENYAKRVGSWWSNRLSQDPVLAEGNVPRFVDDIEKSYRQAYSNTAYYAKNVQQLINDKARIGMRVLEPAVDEERLAHLLGKLVTTEDAGWLFGVEAVENFCRAAVTDTIRANARIQSEAGIYSYIERDPGAGCCDWCDSMAGTYIYGDEPDGFYQVHKGCTCSITYKPAKRPVQHIRYETNGGTMRKITTFS